MSRKNKSDKHGFVYSTNPDFGFEHEEEKTAATLPPQQQKLRIKLDTKHRGGKTVTLIAGFNGTDDDLQILEKALKNFCGTGGSAKEGGIIIQGDQRDKVLQWLVKNGYKNAKRI